jgi:hypothetical protein
MKAITLKLSVIALLLVVLASCKKDKYPPSLTLELEPYVFYYNDTKYTLYDAEGNRDPQIPDEYVKLGDIQQYIDLNTNLKYTIDDKGEFWSAEYLNETYNYPAYKVTSYSDNTPTVKVDFDESIGIENEAGIDLAAAGLYTFTYIADDDGETTSKVVHLRVYNSYYSVDGQYYSMLSRLNTGGSLSLWTHDYTYGEGGKPVTIETDNATDRKFSVNRVFNNKKVKGTIKGDDNNFWEAEDIQTKCSLGAKKGDKNLIEIEVAGEVVDDDLYVISTGTDQPDTIRTLIVVTNLTENNITKGRLESISVLGSDNERVLIPLIAIEYKVERFKPQPGYSGTDAYEYGGSEWKRLDASTQNWTTSFRETFVKMAYYTGDPEDPTSNKSIIINASGHDN